MKLFKCTGKRIRAISFIVAFFTLFFSSASFQIPASFAYFHLCIVLLFRILFRILPLNEIPDLICLLHIVRILSIILFTLLTFYSHFSSFYSCHSSLLSLLITFLPGIVLLFHVTVILLFFLKFFLTLFSLRRSF